MSRNPTKLKVLEIYGKQEWPKNPVDPNYKNSLTVAIENKSSAIDYLESVWIILNMEQFIKIWQKKTTNIFLSYF